MKPTTQNIKTALENEQAETNINNLLISNPTYTNQETTAKEAIETFFDLKELILESIDKGIFDELSFNKRNTIYSRVNHIRQYSNNIAQIIPQINALKDDIDSSSLYFKFPKALNFELEAKEIIKLRRKYKKIVNEIETTEELLEEIKETNETIDDIKEKLATINLETDSLKEKLDEDITSINSKIENISEKEQEIENRKKSILAFSENVDKTEKKINTIQNDLSNKVDKEISDKILKATKLIEQAETALELKETEGISKAFSARLSSLHSSKAKMFWLIGSVVFVFITLLFGFLLTGGEIKIWVLNIAFDTTDNIGIIIGRIMVTLIGISGAVFCSNQYIRINNVEEDYEYKVVLSKSILAFANKIKSLDDNGSKVAEYLTRVLEEIHQDPLRTRKSKKKENNEKDLDKLKKITDIIGKFPVNN